MRPRGGVSVLLLAALALAGCGSSSSTTGSTGATTTPVATATGTLGWTGMGATLADWERAHPKGSDGCSAGHCYGRKVQLNPGESMYEFTTTETSGPPEKRVTGYTQALGEGVILAAAKAAVLQVLPLDTKTLAFWVEHKAGSCALWNVRSATLGRWFAANPHVGDSQGVLGIDLRYTNANGESEYDPNKLSIASIGVAANHRGDGC
jgi:hypothetical protein